jgi:hypothetical protein
LGGLAIPPRKLSPERPVISRQEALEQLKERGLPVELLDAMRDAPAPLDDDDEED